jgi:hypothetical protein
MPFICTDCAKVLHKSVNIRTVICGFIRLRRGCSHVFSSDQPYQIFIVDPGDVCSMFLTNVYRVSQEESAILREGVPYVKIYRYNPKYLCPKLNGYGDNSQRKVWSSGKSTHCTYQLRSLSCCPCDLCLVTAHSSRKREPFLYHI